MPPIASTCEAWRRDALNDFVSTSRPGYCTKCAHRSPREDHLIPLMVALDAAHGEPAARSSFTSCLRAKQPPRFHLTRAKLIRAKPVILPFKRRNEGNSVCSAGVGKGGSPPPF